MNTKIKDGAIPVDPEVLKDAGITTETALAVRSNGDGTLVVEPVDELEKVIEENFGHPMSAEELDVALARVDSVSDKS